jgi:3-hydroxyacyl-CoA dehydrogenase
MTDKPVVRFDVEDGIGVITVDYPPVNALGPGVSDGIVAALDKGLADPKVKAFVLMGAGRSFIAGADIRQFGKPRPTPTRRTYDVMDQGSKPIVAAIHGYALAGSPDRHSPRRWGHAAAAAPDRPQGGSRIDHDGSPCAGR